jgi:biotin carboxyl carrier protein
VREAVAAATSATEAVSVPEVTMIPERVVVSPCAGRFMPLPPEVFTSEGEWVEPGQPVAEVHNGRGVMEVRSPFRGWMMGMLALPGQPVREGEALFWVRSC